MPLVPKFVRITWGSLKNFRAKATPQPNYLTVSGRGTQASVVFEAPQVITICRKIWEPLGYRIILFLIEV